MLLVKLSIKVWEREGQLVLERQTQAKMHEGSFGPKETVKSDDHAKKAVDIGTRDKVVENGNHS